MMLATYFVPRTAFLVERFLAQLYLANKRMIAPNRNLMFAFDLNCDAALFCSRFTFLCGVYADRA